MAEATVELYDATLRDGMQGEGMALTAAEKVRVAHALDDLGIDIIEAGFPTSNPKELELFKILEKEDFDHAQVAAFGMTRRSGVKAEDDATMQERFTIPRGALELDDTLGAKVPAARSAGGTSKT